MSNFGLNFGLNFGDNFGDVGLGGAIPPIGPEGAALLAWDPASSGARQTLEWRTGILKSQDGYERRVAHLQTPREGYQLSLWLGEGPMRAVRSRLLRDPDAVFLLPLFPEALTAFAVSGTSVTLSSTALALADWAVPGQRIALAHGDTFEEFTLQTATGDTVTLDVAPTATFPANLTALVPLAHVILEDGQGVGRYRVEGGRWEVAARAVYLANAYGTGAAAETTLTVSGTVRRIVTPRPVPSGLTQEQTSAGLEVLDYGGARENAWQRSVADIARTYDFTVQNAADRQFWKDHLFAVRGPQTAFLMPTWASDLLVHTNPSGTTLRVYNPTGNPAALNYVTDWWPSVAHKQLQLVATDGTIYYRTVTAAVDLGDGTQNLTLGATLTATLAQVSFLELVRLAADRVEWQWSGHTARLSLPMLVVQR